MNRVFPLLLILIALACGFKKQRPNVTNVSGLNIAVDSRIELFSILCRLAGYREYTQAPKSPYTAAVDRHFSIHGDHPAVLKTAELKRTHSIGYDAPMELAVYLDASFQPIRPFTPLPPGLDPRFEGAPLDDYLAAVRDFAKTSGFDAFFRSQGPYYAEVEGHFRDLLHDKPIVPWFDGVFGKRRNATYRLVPAPMIYPMSYGVRAVREEGNEDIVQVMFLEKVDDAGLPHPSDRTLEFTVHEVAHSYVNPLFDPQMSELEPAFLPLFRSTETAMKKQSYLTYPLALNESVVRAVTLLFLREKASAAFAKSALAEEKARSFLWIEDLTSALATLRAEHGGRLPPDKLVETTRQVFTRWQGNHPPP